MFCVSKSVQEQTTRELLSLVQSIAAVSESPVAASLYKEGLDDTIAQLKQRFAACLPMVRVSFLCGSTSQTIAEAIVSSEETKGRAYDVVTVATFVSFIEEEEAIADD